jgi:hypothetical protein
MYCRFGNIKKIAKPHQHITHIIPPILIQFIYIETHFIALFQRYKISLNLLNIELY